MAKKPKETEPKEKKKKEFKNDIMEVLAAADKQDSDYYNRLSDNEKKGIYPLILMRWMSGLYKGGNDAEHAIITTNLFVNFGFWELAKHPELQWKLLSACGLGSVQRHAWIKQEGNTSKTAKLDGLILQKYPHYNKMELEIVKAKLTQENVKQLCRDFGMADNEIKPISEEFKRYKENSTK